MEELFKRQNGITLIALVITIIVLLILASVSIAMLTGENGILTQATNAKEETRGGAVQEARDLWKTNKKSDQLAGTSTAQSLDELLAELKSKKQLSDEEIAIIKETGSITIGSRTIEFGTGEDTLVAMFKKAQEDGCINENGTCSDPTHLHIGDYVDYKNPTSGSYTVTSDKSGVNYEQTYNVNVAENQLNWRVLGIDETTGGIKLIAGSPMRQVARGPRYRYFDIKGAEGYVYVPDELDKIGALYKNNYAQSARSVNMDDINQALGIKTEEQIKAKNVLPLMSNAIQYGEKYGPFTNQWTPEDWLKADQPKFTVEGTVNGYAFAIGSEGLPPEANDIAINIENTRLNNMLFDNVEYKKGKAYWLASRGVFASSDEDSANFAPGVVNSEVGVAMAGVGLYAFGSYGREDDGSGLAAVRPVVSLKSEITKNEVPKIADRTEPEWEIPQ